MATTQLVKVTVDELSKFGFKTNGRYVNYSKQLSEKDKAIVVPGAQFEAEFYVADSGKEYLNKVVHVLKSNDVPEGQPKATSRSIKPVAPVEKKEAPKASESTAMSKAEWQAKDRSQLLGGLFHDASTLTASLMNINGVTTPLEAVSLFEAVLYGLLKVREGVK